MSEKVTKIIRRDEPTEDLLQSQAIQEMVDDREWAQPLGPELEIRARVRERTPAGARIATAAEIVDVVLFLCSPRARWIVGQTIVADGGMSLLL